MKSYLQIIFALITVINSTSIAAQHSGAMDRQVLQKSAAETSLVDSAGFAAYIKLANHWIYYNPDSAEYYVDKILLALPDHPEIPGHLQDDPYLIKGWVYQSRQKLEQAREWMKKSLEKARYFEDSIGISTVQLNLMSTFNTYYSPSVVLTIDTLLQSLDTTKTHDQYIFLQLQNLKALQMLDGGFTEDAVRAVLIALESGLINENEQNRDAGNSLTNSLAYIYQEMGNDMEAVEWMKKVDQQSIEGSLSWKWSKIALANFAIQRGDSLGGIQLLAKVVKSGIDKSTCFYYYDTRLRLEESRKDWKKVTQMLDSMLLCNDQLRSPQRLLRMKIIRGQLAYKTNDYDAFEESIAEAEAIALQHPTALVARYKRDLTKLRILRLIGMSPSPIRDAFYEYIEASNQFDSLTRNRTTQELSVAYKTRIRQDSIANLTVRGELAEQETRSRTLQLSLAGLLALGLVIGLIYFLKLNGQLKERNKEIQSQNQQLTTARQELEAQNHQIQLLNQDLNHRTSNYLDSIIILLSRQRYSAAAAGMDVTVVNNLERQVLAFTKVQEKLGADLDTVNLKEYLEDFCGTVRAALAAQGRPVRFDTNIADVDVKPAFAAPLALIINELATNSMKYARREDGILRIALDAIEENDGELRVFYRDGGSQEGEIDQTVFSSGQGVELVLGFTDELKGEVIRYGEESYDYEVVFGLVG
jgi:two-component sensor histidine kinase